MSQPHDSELETAQDDWGDFGAVISQLEQEEKTEALTESNQSATEPKPDNTESLSALLGVVFMISEKATSIVSGVDFEFDEKGKQEVIGAALPVLNKHGGVVAGWMGDYVEEATLILAVLGLVYVSRNSLKTLKAEKLEKERREQDGKEKARAAKAA
ncbi:hypothetical protein [Vibrio sp. SCSIO 43137]|uniref:hypothetical protein n=1 Tax=Vibrio sp. SCSIO 43137 TaxID=3021011 RepID=UPI0023082CA5|nr:hypothetical protein [Vibrio sp. SCSIO 43137]WCE31194.1 hypothetical protein PK654_01230 [Vibrio sp. SCSIO 43137]